MRVRMLIRSFSSLAQRCGRAHAWAPSCQRALRLIHELKHFSVGLNRVDSQVMTHGKGRCSEAFPGRWSERPKLVPRFGVGSGRVHRAGVEGCPRVLRLAHTSASSVSIAMEVGASVGLTERCHGGLLFPQLHGHLPRLRVLHEAFERPKTSAGHDVFQRASPPCASKTFLKRSFMALRSVDSAWRPRQLRFA
jgi:hypothetical protein